MKEMNDVFPRLQIPKKKMKANDIVVISFFSAATALMFLCFLCQKRIYTHRDPEKNLTSENTTAQGNGGIFILTGAAAMATMSGSCGGGGCGGGGCGGGGGGCGGGGCGGGC